MTRCQSPSLDEAKMQDGLGRMMSVVDKQLLKFLSGVATEKICNVSL